MSLCWSKEFGAEMIQRLILITLLSTWRWLSQQLVANGDNSVNSVNNYNSADRANWGGTGGWVLCPCRLTSSLLCHQLASSLLTTSLHFDSVAQLSHAEPACRPPVLTQPVPAQPHLPSVVPADLLLSRPVRGSVCNKVISSYGS